MREIKWTSERRPTSFSLFRPLSLSLSLFALYLDFVLNKVLSFALSFAPLLLHSLSGCLSIFFTDLNTHTDGMLRRCLCGSPIVFEADVGVGKVSGMKTGGIRIRSKKEAERETGFNVEASLQLGT